MILMMTDTGDIFYNLAAEYYLATEKQPKDTIFMLWQTWPPTLVCGRYQNVFQEVHMPYVTEKNYVVARRLSGGGTVYQDENVFQYAFVSPSGDEQIDFGKYLEPVAQAMRRLGVPVEFNSRNDLMIGSHKVSGSAQYHTQGYIVHHGTVLYDANLEELERCLAVDGEKIRSKGITSVRERVINIKQYTGGCPVHHFMESLSQQLIGGAVQSDKFSAEEQQRIHEIAQEKFSSWSWIYGTSPQSEMLKTGRVPGGRIEFHLTLKKGRIRQCDIRGDFFTAKDLTGLTEALYDCKYAKKDLQECLEKANGASYFHQISNKELLEILF